MPPPLVIPYFIPHLGCPHQCVFCNQSVITGETPIDLEARQESADIETLINEYLGFRKDREKVEFAFFGGNFLGLPKARIVSLLQGIQPFIEKGEICRIRCSTRPDTVTSDLLDLVSPYGLDLVELGVQSMDDTVLKLSGRGHTKEDTLKAVQTLKDKGFKVGVQVMVGLPGDTREKAIETAKSLIKLSPDLARIYPALVLNGSKLAQWYESGKYTPLNLEVAISQTKDMLVIFERAGVKVVRMGLQASDMMDDPEQMIAGPWHPAFGHLVFSSLMFDRACEQINDVLKLSGKGLANPGCIELKVHPRSLSRLQGDKKSNIKRLANRYPNLDISIKTDETVNLDRVTAHLSIV